MNLRTIPAILILMFTPFCQLIKKNKEVSTDTGGAPAEKAPVKDIRTKPLKHAVLIYKNQRFNHLTPVSIYGKKKVLLELEFDKDSERNELLVSKEDGPFEKKAAFSNLSSFLYLLDTGKKTTTSLSLRTVAHKKERSYETNFQITVRSFKEIQTQDDIKETILYLDGKEISQDSKTLYQKSVMIKVVFDDTPLQKISVRKKSDGSESVSKIYYGSALHLARLLTGQDKEEFIFTVESGTEEVTKSKTFTLHLDDPHILTTKAYIDPSTVRISCSPLEPKCPDNIGVLYTIHKLGTGYCTSSYIGNKTFVTNGHCVPRELLGKKNVSCSGYMNLFLPFSNGGLPDQKKYPCDKIIDSALEPDADYAFYTISDDPGVKPLKRGVPASGVVHTWSAYNPGGNFRTIVLKKSTCNLIYDGFDYFPASGQQNTLLHYGNPMNECMLAPGTSGSTMQDNLGQWVALHFSGFTSHTKKSGLAASDFGISEIDNIKTGINTACLPEPGQSIPRSCTSWISHTNKRVGQVFQQLGESKELLAKISDLEKDFAKSSINSDLYNDYDFSKVIFGYNKTKPEWHLVMPEPDCVDPNTIFYAPVCFLKISFNNSLTPTGFTIDRCENKIGFTLNNENQILVTEEKEVYASYQHSVPACEED